MTGYPLYLWNKETFSTSASIRVKINIDIHLFHFCVIIKGVSIRIMCVCARLCAHVCDRLVAYDHVLLFRKLEMATLTHTHTHTHTITHVSRPLNNARYNVLSELYSRKLSSSIVAILILYEWLLRLCRLWFSEDNEKRFLRWLCPNHATIE